ncbi:hypothetical protein CRE_22945 [Caenorhabditis remanei]|uniref:Uncharacterized protein n=1 Tax=Caenorhabditis remanei TaxID=31234 RepID=E3MW79_CAERE|nr:hypothetical protein CRE_22945 [Caenorhabditis remanei]
MGNTNTIPVVSQVKSAVQLVPGDVEGAARTQERFFHEGIGVSQVTAAVYAVTGNAKKAEETFDRGMSAFSSTVDGIPVVGHMKGAVHYAMGDDKKGDRSMLSASRTTGVMAGGAAGFLVGGPVGAVTAGMASGTAFDVGHTVVTDKPQGYIGAVGEFVENPSAGTLFDAVAVPVGDAFTGYQGGKLAESAKSAVQSAKASSTMAQAETALAKAEAMSEGGGYNSGQVKAQYDVAQNLYNKAENIRTGGKPTTVFDPKTGTGGATRSGGPAVIATNSKEQQKEQETCQATTIVSSSSSITYTSPLVSTTSKTCSQRQLSKTEVTYYQVFQSVLEAYAKIDPLIDLSKYIIECKQILKGVGVAVIRTVVEFNKQIFDEKNQQNYDYKTMSVVCALYDSVVAEEYEEDCPLKGYQIVLRVQYETMGSLHILLSHPQDCQTLLKDLDTLSFPAEYQEAFNKHKPLTEGEKDSLYKKAIEKYAKDPSKRAQMLPNELQLIAYLQTQIKPQNYAFHQFYLKDGENGRQQLRNFRVIFNVLTLSGKRVQLCLCLSCTKKPLNSAIVYESPNKEGVERDCYEIITAFIYK